MFTYEDLGINKTSVYQGKTSNSRVTGERMLALCNLVIVLVGGKHELIRSIKNDYIEIPKANESVFERIDKLEKLCNEMLKVVEELKPNAA